MNTRWIHLPLVAALLLPALGVVSVLGASRAQAQEVEIEGPLAGKPAVIYLRQYRKFRLQIQPGVARTLTDEYATAHFATLQLQFHLTDWLGIGLWGGYNFYNMRTALTREIVEKGVTTDRNRLSLPTNSEFGSQIGRLRWVGAAQATFAPLRGKLALFQKIFVDTDLYIFGGIALVGVEERADTTAGICGADTAACRATQTARKNRLAIAPTMGVGLTMYFNNFLGLAVEWRAMPFAWNTSGTDESGPSSPGFPDGVIDSGDTIFHLNHMVHLGFIFYLPTQVKVTGKDEESASSSAAAATPEAKPAADAAPADKTTEGGDAAPAADAPPPDDGLVMDGGEEPSGGLVMEGDTSGGDQTGEAGMVFGEEPAAEPPAEGGRKKKKRRK